VRSAETRHFKGVRHATTGFFGQGLDYRVTVKVRDQYRITRFEFSSNGCTQRRLLLRRQRFRLLGIEVGLDQKSFRNLRHVRKTCKR